MLLMTSSAQLQPEPQSAVSQLNAKPAELLGNTERAGQERAAVVRPVPPASAPVPLIPQGARFLIVA